MAASSPAPRRTSPTATPHPRVPPVGVIALSCGGLAVAVTALVTFGWRPAVAIDVSVARALHDLAHDLPGWTRGARLLTDWVWDPVTLRLLLAAVAAWAWWRGRQRLAIWLLGSTALGALLQNAAKAGLNRERPRWENPLDSAHFAALPSGHAMTAALVCGLLAWVAWGHRRRWVVLVCGGVTVLGVSATRVFLGVHWLTDVVVGTLLGCGLAAATVWLWTARR